MRAWLVLRFCNAPLRILEGEVAGVGEATTIWRKNQCIMNTSGLSTENGQTKAGGIS